MHPSFFVSAVILTVSAGISLTAQAQPSSTANRPLAPPTHIPRRAEPSPARSSGVPSTFSPGVNPSGFINYNQPATITGSSGFTVPCLDQPHTNPIYNNPNTDPVFNRRSRLCPSSTINAFPPYDPYTINPPPSIYNPALGNPPPSNTDPFTSNPNSFTSNPNPLNGTGNSFKPFSTIR
jgi:hypothetical protein